MWVWQRLLLRPSEANPPTDNRFLPLGGRSTRARVCLCMCARLCGSRIACVCGCLCAPFTTSRRPAVVSTCPRSVRLQRDGSTVTARHIARGVFVKKGRTGNNKSNARREALSARRRRRRAAGGGGAGRPYWCALHATYPNLFLTPDLPHPAPQTWRLGPDKFFFSRTPHMCVQNDQCDENIIVRHGMVLGPPGGAYPAAPAAPAAHPAAHPVARNLGNYLGTEAI